MSDKFDLSTIPNIPMPSLGNRSVRPVSEGMMRRDTFFQECWMELKFARPDLWELMSKLELSAAGYTLEKSDDTDETGTDIDVL